MRPSKETKPNRGFRGAFRAGIAIIIILSLAISWITVAILRSTDGSPKKVEVEEEAEEVILQDQRDTVFVEKVKEVKVTDTFYKYIPAPKPKVEEKVAPKRDTLPK